MAKQKLMCCAMGKTPVDRVATILRKIDSAGRSRERGFNPKKKIKDTSNKFIRRIERIFNNLPNPLGWRSFFNHDLLLLIDFCEEVREVSIHHRLNRSQTRALEKLDPHLYRNLKGLLPMLKGLPIRKQGMLAEIPVK